MERNESETKIGAGHASAMLRQGWREIRAAVYAESNVAQPAEYGLYGTRTPGEVAESRRADSMDLEEERGSILEDRLAKAEASRDDRGREDKDVERE